MNVIMGRGGIFSSLLGLFILGTVFLLKLTVYALAAALALVAGIVIGVHALYKHYRKPKPLPRAEYPKPSMSEIIRRK